MMFRNRPLMHHGEVFIMRALTMIIVASLIVAISTPRQPLSPGVSAQERLRIVIEEVQLPVVAYDAYGHFDPTLTIDDLLVLENGTRQEVRSVRYVPAKAVLLLDTGGELNSAKNTRTTRAIAKNLVATLRGQDEISVLQFNDRVELLQDWTNDFEQVSRTLDTKLLSGKRARLSEGLIAAVSQLGELRRINRHLVLITDGVETPISKFDGTEVLKRLRATNIVVHVISYKGVSQEGMKNSKRILRKRDKSITPDDVVNSLPDDPGFDQLRDLHKPGGIIADADIDRQRNVKEYERAMKQSQSHLYSLTNETGGHMWLPESVTEIMANGADAARLIDSQYIVAYRPKQAVESATEGELRRIDVVSRRVGLHVFSRRHYFVPANRPLHKQ